MAKRVTIQPETKPKVRKALSQENREAQMISLAMDLVEERLRNGTASSQETTHFLKLGSQRAILEKEKLEKENELLKAKTETLQSAKRMEELYIDAIKAFSSYKSHEPGNDDV